MAMDSHIQEGAVPVMFHPDLHKWNIFVFETKKLLFYFGYK